MILPLFSVLDDMPKNIVWASLDLGRTQVQTFMRVVLPYTKTALISGITLVFLPSLTTVAVPQFLNNSPDGSMICDIIVQEGSLAPVSAISLARASSLSLLLSILMVGGYVLMLLSTKGIGKIIRKRREYA
jgi:spermidine/putrescine transport system permease protein